MKRTYVAIISFFIASVALLSCSKGANAPTGPYQLSYGDSILYLRPASGDYIVHPTTQRAGVYEGFPDGIEIDSNTGAINISKSETGLRYLITHTATDGTVTTTKVVLSGITFTDHYFHLSAGDSIAMPVYNASISRTLPLAGSSFDEGGIASTGGCAIKTDNGQINLSKTIRNGVFGATPRNDERKDFDIEYRLNDGSGKALNKLRVRLYYYTSMADVPADLLETLQDREDQGVFMRGTATTTTTNSFTTEAIAKPRPPCIIIIAN